MKGRIYTVHYGANIETTNKFVCKIKPYLSSSIDLVIINNSPEYKITYHQSANITILNAKSNLGYFGGFKYGLEATLTSILDFVIICNNDIEIINDDFFELLKEKLNDYDIIAPSILNSNNNEQNPHRLNKPTLAKKIYYRLYFFNYLIGLVLNKLVNIRRRYKPKSKSINYVAEKEIFSPHGAFIIFNKSFLKKGGYVDDGYFLYGEEDSVASIAADKEMKVGFVPKLKVYHDESTSIGKKLSSKKYEYQKQAFKYIINKYPKIFK